MADEVLPHLDGERRDEEIALAQWQRRQLDELQAANAHLEEQLELERQRTERLMADRDACAQLAEDRLRMLDVATAKVADLDEATDRALALSEENARLRAEIADLKCPDCSGSGRVWVGEDKDRPATCFACNGRGRR